MVIQGVDLFEKNASQKFSDSIQHTGFSVITHHTIPLDLLKQVEEDWRGFFASDDKQHYWYDQQAMDGYFPTENAKGYAVNDLKEFYHIRPNGRFPKQLSNASWELREAMLAVGMQLLSFLQQHITSSIRDTFPESLPNMVDTGSDTVLRIIHYPPLHGKEAEGAVRAAAHADINLITVLPASTQPGLAVQNNAGRWQTVVCEPGALIINAGDMLQELTQGYYRSTQHRVNNPVGVAATQSRYSMPLFIHPKPDVQLSPRYTARSYAAERFREQNLR